MFHFTRRVFLQATMLGHIPTLEAAEEEELLQQQKAAAAAAAANQSGSPTSAAAEEEVEDVKPARSRWEALEAEEEEEEQRRKQQQQQQQQQQQRQLMPERSQLRELNPELAAELEGMTNEELERRCRVNGLSNKGSKQLCMERILALDYYLHADQRNAGMAARTSGSGQLAAAAAAAPAAVGGSNWTQAGADAAADAAGSARRWEGRISIPLKNEPDQPRDALASLLGLQQYGAAGDEALQQPQQQQQLLVKQEPGVAAAPAAAAAVAATRWQEVDEEAEKVAQPEGPVSSWLLQEAEAQRQVRVKTCYNMLFVCLHAQLQLECCLQHVRCTAAVLLRCPCHLCCCHIVRICMARQAE
jgi:hypothetical protein